MYYKSSMKLEEVQIKENKGIVLSIRTTEENIRWLKKHNVSPSLLFNRAIEFFQEQIKSEEEQKEFATKGFNKLLTGKDRKNKDEVFNIKKHS